MGEVGMVTSYMVEKKKVSVAYVNILIIWKILKYFILFIQKYDKKEKQFELLKYNPMIT